MSNWDNEFIFEAYKKQNRPLEESISILLKNDLILANDIYNEWSMSDWHSGVKNVKNAASNVGGFLMKKVEKYITNPILDYLQKTKIWYELSQVKSKTQLADILQKYGKDTAFELVNNQSITNAEKRIQNNESYLGFWDLVLLEAKEKDESNSVIDALTKIAKSLGGEGVGYLEDFIKGQTEIPSPAADYIEAVRAEEDPKVTKEFKKLISILSKIKDLSKLEASKQNFDPDNIVSILKSKDFTDEDPDDIQSELTKSMQSEGSSSEESSAKSSDENSSQPVAIIKKIASKLASPTQKKGAKATLTGASKIADLAGDNIEQIRELVKNPTRVKSPQAKKLAEVIGKDPKKQQAISNLLDIANAINLGQVPHTGLIDLYNIIQTIIAKQDPTDKIKLFANNLGAADAINEFKRKVFGNKFGTNPNILQLLKFVKQDRKKLEEIFDEALKLRGSAPADKQELVKGVEGSSNSGNYLKNADKIFKIMNFLLQQYAPFIELAKKAFAQNVEQPQKEKITVGSLMAQRYGIKNINQAIQILSKSSDPKEIAKAIMFVTFQKNANEEVQPEQFDSVELGLAKKMNQWIDQIKSSKNTSKLKETYLKTGFDKNVVEAISNAFARLAKVNDLDVEEISGDKSKLSANYEMSEIEAMISRIAKGDEKLKQDILNALSSAEERIKQAKDKEEKRQRTEELREFLISNGFATEENISHVMAALDHMGRGGLVKPHESVAEKPQSQVNSTEGLKQKVKQMGSTSFFKIAYDIIMDRQKMMSLGIGMAILFICFLLFGAPFLALLYFAIKAKQSEGGEEQEVEQPQQQPQEEEPQQPSAMSNLKQAVVNKGKEVIDKTKKAAKAYMNPAGTTI